MKIIEFKNINVSYDKTVVLKDLNITIKQGENWAILGANGSGKSTFMKLIQSDIHPRKTSNMKKEIFQKANYSIFELKEKLGIITNDLHNYFEKNTPYLSGYEVVISGYYSTIGIFKHQDFTLTQHKKALKVMEFLEISHLKNKKVFQMSTGELRKAIIARALIHNPEAFILDEPTVGLDIKAQIGFINLLRKISKNNTSIILVTHHIEEIFDEIDNIALIANNTIYKKGKKEKVLTNKNLSKIFDIDIQIDKKNGRYFIKSVE